MPGRPSPSHVSLYGWIGWNLVRVFELGEHAAPGLETGVPGGESCLDLLRLGAAVGQAHGLLGIPADTVLVPGQVPDEREHDVPAGTGEDDDADARLAQAARDPLHGPQSVAPVEHRGGLDHRVLLVREPAQCRLRDHRLRGTSVDAEDPGEAERPPPARRANRGADRTAFAYPAVAERRLLAQLADLDELVDAVRREAVRPLAEQKRALADGALLHLHDPH